MVRSYFTAVAVVVALAFGAGPISAAFAATPPPAGAPAQKPAAGKAQTLCPVMGNPIDKKVFTDYKGYRVYFCCKGCIDTFNKEPDKYIKKMQDEGIAIEKTPAK
jgi:YHS domain-containing protein